jgi:hypothetical protein
MMVYYVDNTGVDFTYGRILDPQIRWGEEITFIISLGLIGCAFLLLEKFIKLYANTLVERSKTIETLEIEKEELKKEMERLTKENDNIDLDAPIQKVITTLQNISSDMQMDTTTKDQLSYVIKILSSNKLYAPSLEDKRK